MTRYEAICVLEAAGYTITAQDEAWHVAAPHGSRGAELQPDGALLPEWVVIALAKAVQPRITLQERMVAASRWN